MAAWKRKTRFHLHSLSAGFPVQALTDLPPTSPACRQTPLWLWPHVLSFEAPLVAMLWLAALARLDDLALMPGVLSGLGLAVWVIYLADRLLDAWRGPAESLSIRHRFYHRFRWPIALLVIPVASAALAWLGLWVVPVGLLAHSIALLIPIGLYLVLYSLTSMNLRRWLLQAFTLVLLFFINVLPIGFGLRVSLSMMIACFVIAALSLRWHERMQDYFRKEMAAGLLFAFGCTTWTRFHTLGSPGPDIWVELVLLSVLFMANLNLISARELGEGEAATRLRGSSLHYLITVIAAGGACATGWLPMRLLPLVLAVLGGLLLLEIAWAKRHRLSPEAFRVWADLAIALPALVLLLLPESSPTAAGGACCF